MNTDYEEHFELCGENIICNSSCEKHKHCKLCGKSFYTDYKCRRHFNEAHASRMVDVEGHACFPCKLKHKEQRVCTRAHYHCPLCQKKVINRRRFIKHAESHAEQQVVANATIPLREEAAEPVSVDTQRIFTGDDDDDFQEPQAKRRKSEKKKCPTCNKEMDHRSISRHLRDIHGEEMPKSVCVDEARGLFMVKKSNKGGVGYPIHVQKSVSSSETRKLKAASFCEDDRCRTYMEVAWRSGMKAVECRHIQLVGADSEYKDSIQLQESSLLDISHAGTFKILKNERVQQCLALSQAANFDNAELIVSFPDGENFIHFSVYDGDVHYYSRLGRVIVSCNLNNGQLDCACCRRKRGCVHKAICLWYLHSIGKLESFRVTANEGGDGPLTNTDVPEQVEKSSTNECTVYPPAEEHVVARMCKYLRDCKRVPLSSDRDKSKPLPNRLLPTEKECSFCHVALSRPVLITSNATILTMDSATSGIETFAAKCEACRMYYRYQEFSDGLHNFNDIFLLGLDVCNFLRESLQAHIPLGSVVKVLEERLKTKLNHQTVINAYLHYDALSSHEYKFYCSICGFHPQMLIMDLNRKVAFQCSAETLRPPEGYNSNLPANDIVDCEQFWSNVELTMVARGFPGSNVSEFSVEPDLLNWAPFIGKKTRAADDLLNTEHKKIRQEDGLLEQDCREITEERLLEMLHQSSLREIQTFARQLGLAGTGSKLDVIMNIKRAVSKDDEKFKKAFGKLWGCSGGWASGTCPHGVVYALKFILRSESPRDYVDLLMSMRFQPNITIVDVANLVAVHGNKRKRNMFHPHCGKVAEPTTENVNKGLNGELDISLEWLDNSKKVSGRATSADTAMVHPITGSSDHLCLFDRLHEKNVTKDEEVLRRVTHIRQLNGLVNTQGQEQLNNVYNKDCHFLNSMKPVNHIFLFRSNIDLRNEKINKKNLEDIQAASSCTLSEDMYGRVMIEKTKRTTQPTSSSRSKPNTSHTQEIGVSTEPLPPVNASIGQPGNCSPAVRPVPELSTPTASQYDDQAYSPESLRSISDTSSPIRGTFPSRPLDHVDFQTPPSHDSTAENCPCKDFIPEDSISTCENVSAPQFPSNPTNADPYWIRELNLKMSDKTILENGHWLNDKIVLATCRVLRKDPKTKHLAGLQDVITAEKYGFKNQENFERFVQIVNVRGNHWITLSNVLSCVEDVYVYDSLISLNRKRDTVSYPINVEQCACQLIKPIGFVNMYVANIQQQKGGNDCGLFAIANAVALSLGISPMTFSLKQSLLGQTLIHCLANQDFSSFLSRVSNPKNPPREMSLFQWMCKVHCHCRMPDDGQLMVSCKKCKRWFHGKCEDGDFSEPTWLCRDCQRKNEEARKNEEWRQARLEEAVKPIKELRKVSLKHHETASLVKLYDQINEFVLNRELPDGEHSCGFVSHSEYAKITGAKCDTSFAGVTLSYSGLMFIIIFTEKHDSMLQVFRTLIHEIVHALHLQRNVKGTSHGREYKRIGKEVLKTLRSKLSKFSKPYCDFVIDENTILAARTEC